MEKWKREKKPEPYLGLAYGEHNMLLIDLLKDIIAPPYLDYIMQSVQNFDKIKIYNHLYHRQDSPWNPKRLSALFSLGLPNENYEQQLSDWEISRNPTESYNRTVNSTIQLLKSNLDIEFQIDIEKNIKQKYILYIEELNSIFSKIRNLSKQEFASNVNKHYKDYSDCLFKMKYTGYSGQSALSNMPVKRIKYLLNLNYKDI